MSLTKIFIYFSIIPVILATTNYFFSSVGRFTWGYDNVNEISTVAFALAGLNCLYILYRNYKTGLNSKFWNIFASLMAILFFGYLYIGYSISKINFF